MRKCIKHKQKHKKTCAWDLPHNWGTFPELLDACCILVPCSLAKVIHEWSIHFVACLSNMHGRTQHCTRNIPCSSSYIILIIIILLPILFIRMLSAATRAAVTNSPHTHIFHALFKDCNAVLVKQQSNPC